MSPFVILKICSDISASIPLMQCAAPSSNAVRRRDGTMSTAITVAPRDTAAISAAMPTPPIPQMPTVCPGFGYFLAPRVEDDGLVLTCSTLRIAPAPVDMPHPRGARSLIGVSSGTLTHCPDNQAEFGRVGVQEGIQPTLVGEQIAYSLNEDWPKKAPFLHAMCSISTVLSLDLFSALIRLTLMRSPVALSAPMVPFPVFRSRLKFRLIQSDRGESQLETKYPRTAELTSTRGRLSC